MEERNTTAPRVSCFMKNLLHAICVTWKPPMTFTLKTSWNFAGSISSGPPCPSPWFAALLTRMSRRPDPFSIVSKSAVTCARSEMSHACDTTPPTPLDARIAAPLSVDAALEPHM